MGAPVLIAYGLVAHAPWHFFVLLPLFFLGFILLPGAVGGLACLLIVNFVPRRRKQVLAAAEPVYETLPGWRSSTEGVRDFAALPPNAQRYVERVAELVGADIGMISTGADRADTVLRAQSAIVSWFQ